MSNIEFESPANRIISQFAPKNKFTVNPSLSGTSQLRQLSIQGRLRYDTATNATVTVTPAVGSTQFFYQIYLTATSAFSDFTISNDGMVRSILRLPSGTSITLDFFDSLVGDSTKVFTITPSGAGTQITILSWIENTSRIRDVAP